MVVQLAHFDLPSNFVGGPVLDLDGQVSTIVEAAELCDLNGSSLSGVGLRLLDRGFLHGFVQG